MMQNQCYWRDDDGNLWLAQSFVDADGVTVTTQTLVPEPGQDQLPE